MKKLGTPIGAGPGSAKEKLGFEGVGTPPLVRGGGGDEGLVGFFFFFLFCCPDELPDPLDPTLPAGAGWLDGRWLLPGELGLGAVVVGVVDDGVVLDLLPEPLPEPPVVVVWDPLVVVGVVLPVLVVGTDTVGVGVDTGGGQTLEISVAPAGSAAPGGSWICTTCPVIVFTVTVQSAADATGMAAKPITVPKEATAATAILSFLLLNTVGFVLPPFTTRMSMGPRPIAA
jgi:hypothetical protein